MKKRGINMTSKQKKMIYIGAAVVAVLIAILCYIFFALGKKSGAAPDELKTDSITALSDTIKSQQVVGQPVDDKADEVKAPKEANKKEAPKDNKDDKKKDKVTDESVKQAAKEGSPDVATPSQAGGQESQELTPAGWREELTRVIESVKARELTHLKQRALDIINRSDDEKTCTNIANQIVDRENYLNDLNKYRNAKISQKGAAIANQLYSEILEGNYNPTRWQKMLKAIADNYTDSTIVKRVPKFA